MDAVATSGEIVQPRSWRLRLPERLPDLKGRWLAAYSMLWLAILPFAIAGAVFGTILTLTTPTMWTPYGFSTAETAGGLRVEAVTSRQARNAGLAPGDFVVAIDGWTVPHAASRSAARMHVIKPENSATSFTFRKPGGGLLALRLVRSRAVEEQAYRDARLNRAVGRAMAVTGSVMIPALFIPSAILLFVRRRREAVPALLSLSFLTIAGISNNADLMGISPAMLSALGSASSLFLFAALYAFPSGRFEPRWTAVPFLLLPFLAIPDNGTIIGTVMGLAFGVGAMAALVGRYRRLQPGPERLQLRWAFFGLVVGLVLTCTAFAGEGIGQAFQGEDPRWLIWQVTFVALALNGALSVMALGLLVSILRYRLYDADAVIGRSVAYGVLTVGFVVLFAGSEKLIELLGQEYLGQNIGGLAGGIGAALAAVAIAPMHDRTRRWAEKKFQRPLYRLRNGLPALVGDLRETSGLDRVAGATLDSLLEGVRARRAAMIVDQRLVDAREIRAEEVELWRCHWSPSHRDGIDCDASDPLLPVRVPLEAEGHGRVGWLLLGPRPDGTLFGKAEFDAIEEVADAVARAVQVVIARQEREDRYEERFAAIEKRILELASLPSAKLA